jgi:hypothetical protein
VGGADAAAARGVLARSPALLKPGGALISVVSLELYNTKAAGGLPGRIVLQP